MIYDFRLHFSTISYNYRLLCKMSLKRTRDETYSMKVQHRIWKSNNNNKKKSKVKKKNQIQNEYIPFFYAKNSSEFIWNDRNRIMLH